MLRRIGSNGWWLFKDAVEHLLSSLFPVAEFSKRMDEAPWDKYASKSIDPMRELEPFESWAGNVKVKRVRRPVKQLIAA